MKNRIYQEIKTETIVSDDGVVSQETTKLHVIQKVSSERFVMLFLENDAIQNLLGDVLHLLMSRASFNTNSLYISSKSHEEIGEKLGIAPDSVKRQVKRLVASKILISHGNCHYTLNPEYVWFGSFDGRIKLKNEMQKTNLLGGTKTKQLETKPENEGVASPKPVKHGKHGKQHQSYSK